MAIRIGITVGLFCLCLGCSTAYPPIEYETGLTVERAEAQEGEAR
jgi:hypothetical protein